MNAPNQTGGSAHIFLRYHLPAILYAAAIIAVSSIPNLSSPHLRLISLDKVAHFLEYATFAILTFRSISHISPRISLKSALLYSAVFLSIFALLDETYQRLIPGRHMDLYDVAVDVIGALLVLSLLGLRQRRIR